MLNLLRSKRGEGYIDVIVIVLVAMLFIAFAVKVFPIFIVKSQLDTFAAELCREAEISGGVGEEVEAKTEQLKEQTGLNPTISWSSTGNIQLNTEITVTVKETVNIGFFSFGSFPIELTSKATGRSEVYYK